MNGLEMPFSLPGVRVQADERFSEQVLPGTLSTKKVVARRSQGKINKPSFLIERNGRPGIDMAGVGSRIALPAIVAKCAFLWNGVEIPHSLAGAHIVSPHVPRRVPLVNHTVVYAVAQDDQVLVNDWWGCVGVVLLVHFPQEA